VDADGDLDLLAGRKPLQDVALFRGDGLGGFLPQLTVPVGGPVETLSVADLDIDGRPDIVATIFNQPTLAIALGLGSAAFAAPQTIALTAVPDSAPVLADLDGNGLPDIAVPVPDGVFHDVDLYFAQAPMSFASPVAVSIDLYGAYSTGYAAKELRAADLDRDGRTDLVAINGTRDLLVLRNGGNGAFAEPVVTATDDAHAFVLADFNGDSSLDVAVTAESSTETIQIFPNLDAGFANVGYQHTTSFATPHLLTSGAPVPDEKASFTATGLPAPTLGALFLGLEFSPQPFAGGTLVPSPDVLLPMRAGAPLAGRWPDLPAGTRVYAQAWFAFGGEVAATNAIEAITP